MKTPAISTLATATAILLSLLDAPLRADILFVSNNQGQNVEKITSGGGSSIFTTSSTFSPWGLAFDSTGNLYSTDYFNNTILKFTPGGVRSVFVDSSKGLEYPRSLAFDSAGNLYVSNSGKIRKITPSGVTSVFASIGLNVPSGQAFDPYGLAFDSADNLYVADNTNNSVDKFTLGGAYSVVADASKGIGFPVGVAFDRTGNLFVSNYTGHNIVKLTIGGVSSVFASGLNNPWDLAFDSLGNLYVPDASDNKISKFTPGGVGSVFASSGLRGPFSLAFTDDAGVPLRLANQVPEPSAALLLLSSLALCGRRRARAGNDLASEAGPNR